MLVEQVIVGGCRSRTTTVKLHPAVLPDASVAVQLTVLVPFGKVEPLNGVQTTLTPAQLSLAVAVKAATCEHWPGAVLVTMLAGQVMLGALVSRTATVKLHPAVLPDAIPRVGWRVP